MSRKTKLQAPPIDEPDLAISAMIDVSFLLLIFFLVTSTLNTEEADLGITLPGNLEPSRGVGIDLVRIEITEAGEIEIYGEVLENDPARRDLPILRQRLNDYRKAARLSGETPVVVIGASDDAEGQRLVDVLNCLAEAGIEDVTLEGFKKS